MKRGQEHGFRGGVLTGAVLALLAVFCLGAGSPVPGFISAMSDALEAKLARAHAAAPGPVVAKIEDSTISKALFEKKYAIFIDTLGLSDDGLKSMQTNKSMRARFLSALVEDQVFLRDFRQQQGFQHDPGFLVFLEMKLHQAVKEYYLLEKIGAGVDKKVDDKEIGELYDRLKAEPRYANAFSRMELAEVRELIRRRIIQERQLALAKAYLDKLKMRYRIETFEDRL